MAVVDSNYEGKLLDVDVSYCQLDLQMLSAALGLCQHVVEMQVVLAISHHKPVADILELVDFEHDRIAAILCVRRVRTAVQIRMWT